MPESTFATETGVLDRVAAADESGGKIVVLEDGRAAALADDVLNGKTVGMVTDGLIDFAAASGTTFAKGELVWWDDTNNLAVNATSANATFPVGPAVAAKASGTLSVRVDLNRHVRRLVKQQLADAATLTNSNTETVLGTYTIPAASLKLGSKLRIRAAVDNPSTNSTDTFRFRVRVGGVAGTVIADTTAIDLANSDQAVIDAEVNVRSSGAGGTYDANGMAIMKAIATATVVGSTAIDTTVGTVTVVVTGVHSVASASNQSILKSFTVEQIN